MKALKTEVIAEAEGVSTVRVCGAVFKVQSVELLDIPEKRTCVSHNMTCDRCQWCVEGECVA